MSNIYAQNSAAFDRVSAWVVMKDGNKVATVQMKFPSDGAGRLYAYVHWLTCEMTRGFAGGGGYDKRSAAVADAARNFAKLLKEIRAQNISDNVTADCSAFYRAIADDSGKYWYDRLSDAGFQVIQAV